MFIVYTENFLLIIVKQSSGVCAFHGWLHHIHKRDFLGMLVFWKYIYIEYSICVNICHCIWIVTYVAVLSKVCQEMPRNAKKCESVCQVGEYECGFCLL